jgi:hypothetical protein
MLTGYAHTSIADQHLALMRDGLHAAGYARTLCDMQVSNVAAYRPRRAWP